MKLNTAVSWSGGKDSLLCLERADVNPKLQVFALFTTYNSETGMLPIQGIPVRFIREQAQRLGLPLIEVPLVPNAPNDRYEKAVVQAATKQGLECLVFGDVFLNDVRRYRERFLSPAEIQCEFPLFGEKPHTLALEIFRRGIKARISSIDKKVLPATFCGCEYDKSLLQTLPRTVDPCGENGEFHTVVYDSPSFSGPVSLTPAGLYEDAHFTYLRFG